MSDGISLFSGLFSLAIIVWFVCFTVLVLQKLDKVIEALGKK